MDEEICLEKGFSAGAESVPFLPSLVLAVSGHEVSEFSMPNYNGRKLCIVYAS